MRFTLIRAFSSKLKNTFRQREVISVIVQFSNPCCCWQFELWCTVSTDVIQCLLSGHLVPGMLLIVLSYLDCNQSHIAVVVLTLAIGLGGLAFCGILINFYDIAPVYATKIMTVSNAVSMIPGILVPYVVAEVTKDVRSMFLIGFILQKMVIRKNNVN